MAIVVKFLFFYDVPELHAGSCNKFCSIHKLKLHSVLLTASPANQQYFSHTKSAPATSQPAVIFSHNKPAPATSCNNSLNVLFDVAVVVEIIDFGEDLPELHAGSCTYFVSLL